MSATRRLDLDAVLETTPLRLLLFLLLVVLAFPIFEDVNRGGPTFDWQFFQFFEEVARRTVLKYHQLPIWNPYFCGGTTLIGNPQTTFLVPTFPLVLVFGTTLGMRLSEMTVVLVGCEGCWRLMRHLGARPLPALLGAVAYPLFGRTFGWLHDGQYGLHAILLFGWVLYGYLRGLERPRYLVLGAAFWAWILAFRGIEPGPQIFLALLLWALLETRQRFVGGKGWRSLWPLGAGAILGALGAGFIGVRMVPVLETVLRHPRLFSESRTVTLTHAWFEMFAVRAGTPGYTDPGYVYIGLFIYILFWGAVLFGRVRRRAAIPLSCALFFGIIMLGHQGDFSIYPWLKRLPLYQSLRNPLLYSFIATLFVVLGAVLALDELCAFFERRPAIERRAGYALVAVCVFYTAFELAGQGRAWMPHGTFTFAPVAELDGEFRQSRGNSLLVAVWPPLERGTLSCYDETPWPASRAVRADLPAEEYLEDPRAGTLRRARFSPNVLELDYDLARPATAIVNQNWAATWHASVGRAYDREGLLAVDLPAGRGRVRLRMWPPSVTLGLLYMLVSIAAAWWLVRRDRR